MDNELNEVTLNEQESGGAVIQTPPAEEPAPENISYEAQTAEFEKRQQEIKEQDEKLLAALDEVLEKRSRQIQYEREKTPAPPPKVRVLTKSVRKGVGVISLGLILVFLGIVMVACLFSPTPNFLIPLKLSPLCAVLIGLEILLNQIANHGNIRINVPSIIISALLVVGCCVMCVALNKYYNERKVDYNNRSIAAEIYDKSYKELRYVADIASLDVDVDLNPDGSGRTKGLEALSTDDFVNITVNFAGAIDSPKIFAGYCKKIIDGYRFMGIPVTNFYFRNESSLHTYSLDVEGKYAQDFSESRLEEQVNHIYLDNMNYIDDLPDFIDETEDTSTSS